MTQAQEYTRLAWKDRFNQPDAAALREGLPGQVRRLFDAARRHLLQLDEVHEHYSWYGDCWRWSIEYRLAALPPEENLLAVLIPSPEDFQLAMQIDAGLAARLPMRQLKRAVRDGLELASEPFDTRWGVWSIQYANFLEELKPLLARKLDHMKRKNLSANQR